MTTEMPLVAALLQASPQGGWMAVLAQLAPFILIFIIFWLLLIRPARQRQRAHQKMLDELKRGDRVVTNGGLHGEVAGIEGPLVFLKIADNVKVRVSKSAVAALQGETEGGK
ncbi:MAG TPA: preprotein translocase subunit YajC [Thermoanaerobaculia bacterium]|nr:preprotein translocase subunit YajC [Thermoanaerobaculia bacterium]